MTHSIGQLLSGALTQVVVIAIDIGTAPAMLGLGMIGHKTAHGARKGSSLRSRSAGGKATGNHFMILQSQLALTEDPQSRQSHTLRSKVFEAFGQPSVLKLMFHCRRRSRIGRRATDA